MTPETLTALRASIQHWRENVAAETVEEVRMGALDCPLCKVFPTPECLGCPVAARTRRHSCYGSPYYDARWAGNRWRTFGINRRTAFRAAAQAELDFLISLLPEGETP